MRRLGLIAPLLLLAACGTDGGESARPASTRTVTVVPSTLSRPMLCDAAYPAAAAANALTLRKAFEFRDARRAGTLAAELEDYAAVAPVPQSDDLGTLAETMRALEATIRANGGEVPSTDFRAALTRLSDWCSGSGT